MRIRHSVWLASFLSLALILSARVFVGARSKPGGTAAKLVGSGTYQNRLRSIQNLPLRYGLKTGMRLDYTISFRQNAAVSATTTETVRSAAPILTFGNRAIHVDGSVGISVFLVEKDTCWCVADFVHIEPTSKSDVLDLSELKEPVVFVVSSRGKLGLIYTPKAASPATARFWQSALPLLFLPLPQHAETAWRRSYSDSTGTYEAEHKVVGPGLVKVKKLGYRSFNGVAGSEIGDVSAFSLEKLTHEQMFQFHATNSVVSEATVKENGEFSVFRKLRVTGNQEGKIRLQRTGLVIQEELQSRILESFGVSEILELADSANQYRLDEVIPEKDVSSATKMPRWNVDEILLTYAELSSAADNQRNQLFGKLVAVLQAQPGATMEVARKISQCKDDRRLRKWLLDALAYSGSTASSAALAGFVRDGSPDVVSQAIMASGFVRHPPQDLVDALIDSVRNRQMLDPMAVQAALSVAGTLISRLAHDPARRDTLVETLREVEPTAGDEGLLKSYFSAWANTQLPEAKDRILERVPHDASDSLWMGAIFGLENLRHANARDALLEFANDPSKTTSVRSRATRALAEQELPPDHRVGRLISNWLTSSSKDWPTARSALMYLQRAAKGADMEAVASLQQIANSQGDDKASELAQRLIRQISAISKAE